MRSNPPFTMASVIGASPEGDGLLTMSVTSYSVDPSAAYSWVGSWAATTTGLDSRSYSPYSGSQTRSASQATSAQAAPNSSNGFLRIFIPVIVVVLVVLLAGSIVFLLRWRRKRALRAHRRRTSWAASNKFKWHADAKPPFDDAPGIETLPPYPTSPERVTTHERKISIL